MTRVEQLIESIRQPSHPETETFYDFDIKTIMEQYAEEYALLSLMKAAEEAEIDVWPDEQGCYINKSSITNVTLPKHHQIDQHYEN